MDDAFRDASRIRTVFGTENEAKGTRLPAWLDERKAKEAWLRTHHSLGTGGERQVRLPQGTRPRARCWQLQSRQRDGRLPKTDWEKSCSPLHWVAPTTSSTILGSPGLDSETEACRTDERKPKPLYYSQSVEGCRTWYPIENFDMSVETQAQLQDVTRDTMTTTVVGAVILAELTAIV